MNILVIGGSGFIGTRLVKLTSQNPSLPIADELELLKQDWHGRVTMPYRAAYVGAASGKAAGTGKVLSR
jgi:uncharacterized protein YbjT (DUF2867 family)